jgi:hypothetical protein
VRRESPIAAGRSYHGGPAARPSHATIEGVETDRRTSEWPESEPRQRRDAPWPPDEVRQRRRTRWTEFRDAYPRIVLGLTLGLAALVLVDLVLAVQWWRYRRQTAAARRMMTTMERQKADTLLAAREGNAALAMALARQQALQDRNVNLAVDLKEGTMALQREGAQLREMRVEVGPEVTVGQPPGALKVTPPLGVRRIARVVDGSYEWEAPAWVYTHRSRPVPSALKTRGGLGEIAILLDDGTPIYSKPAHGPLADDGFVMPGGVRAAASDLSAVAENLQPGTPVYFH